MPFGTTCDSGDPSGGRWAGRRRHRGRLPSVLAVVALVAGTLIVGSATATGAPPAVPVTAAAPWLGAGVYVFDPSMPQEQIQATVDAVAAQQVDAEFGTGRYALLFRPGTYGTAENPLNFQVGYYTEVAGLGARPGDVVINGTVNVYNRCLAPDNCIALVNFWRSLSNLTINVAGPEGCRTREFWAVSQAAPMRRVQVNGEMTLMDYCTAGPQYASGGFIADSSFSALVVNGSQQQFIVRDSELTPGAWSNGVWNQVFAGVTNAPPTSFGIAGQGPYTTLDTTGLTAERPYLGVDAKGRWVVRVPDTRTGAAGTDWADGHVDRALPLSSFFIANPRTSITAINIAVALGRDLPLTPGQYNLRAPILVSRPNTVVLGLGFPTITPRTGLSALSILQPSGVRVAGLLIDAGPRESKTLLDVGVPGRSGKHGTPTVLSDVFFRIGGPALGRAKVSLQVNASDVVLDHIWAWRADHGQGVGWDQNTADTGVVVRGDRVTAYGLFVEHYQKTEVVWSGRDGTVVMFQNEMPYDPPSQAAWQESPTKPGYPAFEVASGGKGFAGWGIGSYSFFNQGVDIHAATAFRVPTKHVSLHSLLTVFLNGSGGIDGVVNGLGGPTTGVSGVPIQVISYPPLVVPGS